MLTWYHQQVAHVDMLPIGWLLAGYGYWVVLCEAISWVGLMAEPLWSYWLVLCEAIGGFFMELLACYLWGYWLVLCGSIGWFSVGLLAGSL